MNLRLARVAHGTRLGAWTAEAQRFAWDARSLFEADRPVDLTWAVPAEIVPDLEVFWPERYGSSNAPGWVEPIRRGIAHHVPVRRTEIQQTAGNIVTVLFRNKATTFRVAIDYDDLADLHPDASSHDLYFKMQYARSGYGSNSVVPGGYVGRLALYRHVDRWRALRARSARRYPVFVRFGTQRTIPIRTQILELMENQTAFRVEGQGAFTTWWEYMEDICHAEICLDAPGRGELCVRLVECLALGSCVVGPTLGNELHVPLRSGEHLVRVGRDLSSLVETCHELLEDGEMQRRLSAGAAAYFDRYLRLEQLGGYYVSRCLDLFR